METNLKKITAILGITVLICCLIGSASAANGDNLITNGNFANGMNGWTYVQSQPSGSASMSATTVDGVTCLDVRLLTPSVPDSDPTASVSQTIDITNVQTLTWKTKQASTTVGSTGFYCLYIYKGASLLGSYTYSQLGSDWTTRSYNVADLTGQVTIKFEASINYYSGTPGVSNARFYLTDITAIEQSEPASVTNIYFDVGGSADPTPAYKTGDTATVHYVFSKGSYSDAVSHIAWGDGSTSSLSTSSTSITHTYESVGAYTPQISLYYGGTLQVTYDLPTAYIITLDFSADVTSADPGSTITFTPSAVTPAVTGISSYSWDYGDGSSATSSYTHAYNSAGTYTVSVTATLATGSGYTVTKTKQNYITTSQQTISFSDTEVESGDSVTVSWALRDAAYPYQLNIYEAWNTGERSTYQAVQTHTIASASDTSFTFTAGTAGYYTAYIEKNSNVIIRTTTPVNVVTLISLTVNVYNNGIAYTTNQTTVKLYNAAGVLQDTQTTASGMYTVQFNDIDTGSYYVTIEATGQTIRTSQTLQLTDSYTLNIDFTLGSSDTTISGVGSQYATTFITFRTVDKGTGKYIPGVQITATAVQPTNAWEYFANLFGASLGTVIQSMTLNGISDSDGRITFAMYQNVRYNLHVTCTIAGETYTEDRAFQQSSGTGEYRIDIPVTSTSSERYSEMFQTEVNTTDNAIVTSFTDNTGTVTSCTVKVYKKDGDERKDLNMSVVYSNPLTGIPQTYTFTPTDPSGQSYIVSFLITSSVYGTKTQEYGVTFSGVAIKLGDIPNSWYIWISFLILLMTGAVATFVNSRHFAIVICIVATLLFFAGWLNQLGTVAPVALCICYVLTIVYYIANKGDA